MKTMKNNGNLVNEIGIHVFTIQKTQENQGFQRAKMAMKSVFHGGDWYEYEYTSARFKRER